MPAWNMVGNELHDSEQVGCLERLTGAAGKAEAKCQLKKGTPFLKMGALLKILMSR